MSVKVTLMPLVLFGFVLFRMAGECFADTPAELKQAKSSIVSLINDGKYTQAQAQTQKLIADFPENPALPEALYEVADKYQWATKYEQVNSLYQQIIQNHLDSPYVGKARLGLARVAVLSLIISKNYDQAKKDFDKLLVDFSGHPDLPETIYWTAERYQWAIKYEQAKNLYAQVVQDYPDSPWAGNAKLGIARANVLLLIESQQYNRAKEPLEKLFTDFSNHHDLPEAIYWIAKKYGWLEKYVEEMAVSRRLVQNYPDSPFASKAQLAFSRAKVQSLIISQDYDRAEEALDKLITDFSNHPDFPEELYWIAGRYKWSAMYEQAQSLYRQIIQNYPDSMYANKAKLGISITDIMSLIVSHKHDKATKALDKMITDFAGHPDMPKAALDVPEPYFHEALRLEAEGLNHQAKESFRRALAMFEMVNKRFPDYAMTADTFRWIGICYRALGDYEKSTECLQKVVDNWPYSEHAWHAQFLIGCNYDELKQSKAISMSEADAKIKSVYEKLLKDYPGCPANESARNWLNLYNSEKEGSEHNEN